MGVDATLAAAGGSSHGLAAHNPDAATVELLVYGGWIYSEGEVRRRLGASLCLLVWPPCPPVQFAVLYARLLE
jgi:hypothetical protein